MEFLSKLFSIFKPEVSLDLDKLKGLDPAIQSLLIFELHSRNHSQGGWNVAFLSLALFVISILLVVSNGLFG